MCGQGVVLPSLGSKEPLSCCAVSLAVLAILLHCIIDSNVFVEQELAVECLDRSVCRLEAVKRNESISFWLSTCWIPGHLGQTNDTTKCRECLVEQALIYRRVETADKQVGANIDLLAIIGGLVDANWLPIELETVHDFTGIVSILFRLKLGEGVTLMRLRDAILGKMEVDERTSLDHELPDDGVGGPVVDVSNIAGCILVAVELGWARHGGPASM